MFKKILSAALAMTMVMGLTVTSFAAKKPVKKSKSAKTETVQEYDFCKTALKNDKLALKMHDEILKGLKAAKSVIKVNVNGYSDEKVFDSFQKAVQMIFDQHPEIFWLDVAQNVVLEDGTLTFYPRPAKGYGEANHKGTSPSKIDKDAISKTTAELDKAVKGMEGNTRYEMVKNIHDTIIKGNKYPENPDKATHNQHQAVGALLEGESVCDGYAKAIKYACDKKGIPCLIVRGYATNNIGESGSHAWNYVQMEDGKWYQIDADWDDPQVLGDRSKNYLSHEFFLKGDIKNDTRKPAKGVAYPKLSTSDYKAQ